MMRRAAGLLILCAVAGCGGGGGSDTDQVRDALRTFAQAAVDGDADKVCDQFTAETRKQIAVGGQGCAAVFKAFGPQLKTQAKQQLAEVDKLKITVDGDSAKASRGGGQAIDLRKEDGDWKLAVTP